MKSGTTCAANVSPPGGWGHEALTWTDGRFDGPINSATASRFLTCPILPWARLAPYFN
jgi:hypothetical protein